MYWPDNEPLPEPGQVRPFGSAVIQVSTRPTEPLYLVAHADTHFSAVPSHHQHWKQGCGGEAAWGLGLSQMQVPELETQEGLPDLLPL